MAEIRIVTKKERQAENRARFRLRCKGLTKEEFIALESGFKAFECTVLRRNPFPDFTPSAIHEIIAHITGTAIGGYAVKKTIDAAKDLLVAFVRFKMRTVDNPRRRHVTLLYGPDDKVLYDLNEKKSRKR